MLQKSSDGCALTKTTHVLPKCTIESVYPTCVTNVNFIRDILAFLMLTSVQKSEHFTIRFKSYITTNVIKALRLKTVASKPRLSFTNCIYLVFRFKGNLPSFLV